MQLSREAIQRMFDSTGGSGGGGGGGSISPSILASYASQEFVQQNYVSIEFFNRLFKIHGSSTDILPNDTETVISHIEANYGFWTQSFLSAFGYNSSGGGGGGGGDGSVTSVGLSMPAGFSVSGSPVTTSGTLAVNFASGYSLPTTARQANWDAAYGWGDHSLAGYATQQWVTAQGFSTLTMTSVWTALASSSDPNRKINAVHLPDLSSTYLTVVNAATTYAKKATTLAGYGITDAYTKTYIDSLVSTIQNSYALKATTLSGYGITDAYTKSQCDNRYVTIATQQTVTGEKTFSAHGYFSNNLTLNAGTDQYLRFNAGTNKVAYLYQGSGGDLSVYSENAINWYTNINDHVGIYQQGATGYIGINNQGPQYNLDVTGILRATDSIIVGDGKIAWDSDNNALYVQKADGSVCNFYSLGGVSALGVGTSSGASISTLKVTTLNATNVNASSEIVTANIKPTQAGIIDLWTSDNNYYWEFNYQDTYNGTSYYALDCYNVGFYGENSNADNTWRITPEGIAEFGTVVCGGAQLLSNYVYINALVRLRANGATVYLETRTAQSASWVIKETWS